MKRHESREDSHSETWPSENFEPRRLVPAVRQRKTGWRKPDQVFCFIKQILCKYVTECNSYCSKSRQLTQKSDTFRVLYETMFHINVQVPKPSIHHQSSIHQFINSSIHQFISSAENTYFSEPKPSLGHTCFCRCYEIFDRHSSSTSATELNYESNLLRSCFE